MAGFSVSAKLVGRVFALIELIRAEADYILAPVMRKISTTSTSGLGPAHGIRHAAAITVVISIVSVLACVAVWLIARLRFEQPNLERYVDDGEPGLRSPSFV
jgi:hypothetical protein